MSSDLRTLLVLGFCGKGPYRHARQTLQNPTVNWIPWHYDAKYLADDLLSDLQSGLRLTRRDVAFAVWRSGADLQGEIIRLGTIDHSRFSAGALFLTVLLRDLVSCTVPVPDDQVLCFYSEAARRGCKDVCQIMQMESG